MPGACDRRPGPAPGESIDMDAFLVKPSTKADEQTREKKWAELREEFVRTNDPVTFGAMLQQVTPGLTPAERTNKDIAAHLARKPAEDWLRGEPTHAHSSRHGLNQFYYRGAECNKDCPFWEETKAAQRAVAKEARCKNYPCGLCGKHHPDDPCPLEWMRGDPWALGEYAPAWPPFKLLFAIVRANWKRIPVGVRAAVLLLVVLLSALIVCL